MISHELRKLSDSESLSQALKHSAGVKCSHHNQYYDGCTVDGDDEDVGDGDGGDSDEDVRRGRCNDDGHEDDEGGAMRVMPIRIRMGPAIQKTTEEKMTILFGPAK